MESLKLRGTVSKTEGSIASQGDTPKGVDYNRGESISSLHFPSSNFFWEDGEGGPGRPAPLLWKVTAAAVRLDLELGHCSRAGLSWVLCSQAVALSPEKSSLCSCSLFLGGLWAVPGKPGSAALPSLRQNLTSFIFFNSLCLNREILIKVHVENLSSKYGNTYTLRTMYQVPLHITCQVRSLYIRAPSPK